MKKIILISLVVGCLLITTTTGVYAGVQQRQSTTPLTIKHKQQAEWTIMVYMDGDTHPLEKYAIKDFLQMASIGSTNDVNIVVQLDRKPGGDTSYGDWTTTKRYLVLENMVPDAASAISDIGEANMGDPQTLIDFVDWAQSNFIADRYCLILYDHGGGWEGICVDESSKDDIIEMFELRNALKTITNDGDNPIDLIFFHACVMQMISVGYEITNYCDYMTGSEAIMECHAGNYDDFLSSLVDNPTMSPEDFGAQIVNSYQSHTLSTLNLGLLDNLKMNVSEFGSSLQNENYRDMIKNAILDAEGYGLSCDLYHFAQLVKDYIDDSEIDAIAQTVMDEIDNVVTSEKHNQYTSANSHGISIFLNDEIYIPYYEDLLFAEDSQWDEFLNWYFRTNENNPPLKPERPSGLRIVRKGEDVYYETVTTDPDEDRITYMWDWGDGTRIRRDGLYKPSGSSTNKGHIWDEGGVYEIRVKALDARGAESPWSEPLRIFVFPLAKQQNSQNSQSSPQSNPQSNPQNSPSGQAQSQSSQQSGIQTSPLGSQNSN